MNLQSDYYSRLNRAQLDVAVDAGDPGAIAEDARREGNPGDYHQVSLADLPHTELDLLGGLNPAELRELDARMWRGQRRAQAALKVQASPITIAQVNGITDDLTYVRRETNRAFFAQWGR